jgi:hypothetical protein
MPQFHSMQSSRSTGNGLPKKHSRGGLLSRYNSGGVSEQKIIDSNAVFSAVREDVRNEQDWRYRESMRPIEPVTPPQFVVFTGNVSKSLQVQSNNQYISPPPPVAKKRMPGVALRAVVYLPRGRSVLVVPGDRTRLRETEELRLYNKRLRPSLRLGLLVISTVCIFLICMVALTPMNGNLQGNLSQSMVAVPESSWNIFSRPGTGSSAGSVGWVDPGASTVAYYQQLAREDAIKWGIPPDLYVAQIQQESHFDPNATSPAGALGIAQFVPATAAEYNFNPLIPEQALDGGAHFMSDLYNEFNGNYAMALAGYNAGSGAVQNAIGACQAYWLSCMNTETQNYVNIIMYGGA